MVEDEFQLVIQAVQDLIKSKRDHRGRGRKSHDPVLLTAITYIMIRNGWSLRDAERWCEENMHLLEQLGYDKPNPPI
ncbi:hypothetical protein Asulf_01099 [Archaeoglobus sulfaticallidus PM70-1]|uniref:Uncharacterized protein n=1 Tax=Archaeoglobus sulfaticallidus PM70-1 TaxID=387631 RepID=N0BBW3_9EURY|nr:hypothetical protein [Archaeoglobus sulfaticallidus]AGK61099.1 hypothetical protein Asulf_01099 [Archaeoglobus sulfaticallidus PM70-1]